MFEKLATNYNSKKILNLLEHVEHFTHFRVVYKWEEWILQGGDGIGGIVTLKGGTLKSTGGTGNDISGSAFYRNVMISEGKVFFTVDGTQSFSGPLELNADQKAAIAGKFLTSCTAAIGETFYPTVQDPIDASNPGDTVKLLTDVKPDATVIVSKNTILDLNGHTIDGSGIETESKTVIKILSAGNLTLNDSSKAKTGLITGGSASNGNGGGVYANGDFTMNGGTISGNRAENYGGGVYVSGRTFTMNGGKICSNTAGISGGGVGLNDRNSSVTFKMNGGTICNNEGGGVFFKKENDQQPSESSFILTGGTIKDNRSNDEKIRNVHLRNGKLINIPEELKENTSIFSQSPLNGNELTLNPAEKDTILSEQRCSKAIFICSISLLDMPHLTASFFQESQTIL